MQLYRSKIERTAQKGVEVGRIFFVIGVLLLLLNGSKVVAVSYDVTSVPTQSYTDDVYCSSYRVPVRVKGVDGPIPLCWYGGSRVEFGTYLADGRHNLGARLRYQSEFQKVSGACPSFNGCIYSEATDTIVTRQLSGLVTYGVVFDRASERYLSSEGFDRSQPLPLIVDVEGRPLNVGAIAVSENGRYVALELINIGIGWLDLENHVFRRVIAPGVQYGRGFDPKEQLAISNDGDRLLVTGENAGWKLIDTSGECGDVPSALNDSRPTDGVQMCSTIPVAVSLFAPSFRFAANPRFIGHTIIFDVASLGQGVYKVRLSTDEPSTVEYVAMGDSFTSGEGETDDRHYLPGTNERDYACHVSDRSYPFIFAEFEGFATAYNVACSGATIVSLLAGGQLESLGRFQPRLSSIGIGGNDAGFMTKLRGCFSPGTCHWVSDTQLRYAVGLEIQRMSEKYRQLFYRLKSVSPLTHFFAVGYPQLFSKEQRCPVWLNTLLDAKEREFIAHAIGYLNEVLKATALQAELSFVDNEAAFGEHGLCGSAKPPAMNDLQFGADAPAITAIPFLKIIASETFHPTPFGHTLLGANIATRYLSDLQVLSEGEQSVPEYFGSAHPMILEHTADVSYEDSTVIIHLPASSVRPLSTVSLAVFSEFTGIGEVIAGADGSINAAIPLDESVPLGTHTVFVTGENDAGHKISFYTVFVRESQKAESSGVYSSVALSDTSFVEKKRGEVLGERVPPEAHEPVSETVPSTFTDSTRLLIFVVVLGLVVVIAWIIAVYYIGIWFEDRGG